jgi:cytochrome c
MGGWEQAKAWAAIGVATTVLLGGFWVGDMLVPSEYPGRMGYKVPDVTAPSVDLAALQRNWPRGLSEPGGDVRLVNYMAHIDRMAPAPATAGTAAPAEPVPDLGTLLARADPAKGKSKAQVCVSCHSFAPNGPNGIGPPLYGIVGHDIASHPGFAYSAPVSAAPGTWTYEKLDTWLASPAKDIPGTKMAFAGIRQPQDRANVLAYLGTLGGNAPLPKPAQ